jgi:lysine biosynthesis protein LysW
LERPVSAKCPECDSGVDVPADAIAGELLFCDHCGVELELQSKDPLVLDLFEEEEK